VFGGQNEGPLIEAIQNQKNGSSKKCELWWVHTPLLLIH